MEQDIDKMKASHHIKGFFKKHLIAGTAVMVPLIGTYLILKFIINFFDDMIISAIPTDLRPQVLLGVDIPGIGIVITLLLILVVGIFTRLYVVRLVVRFGDWIIYKIPLGRSIYSGIKKFMSAITADRSEKFRSVIALEYPRRNCWVIGFVTSDACKEMRGLEDKPLVNVFVPTTPNPTSGFMVIVPKEDTRALNFGIDEAFKLIISGGIVQDQEKTIA